jgi:hypothetical protein
MSSATEKFLAEMTGYKRTVQNKLCQHMFATEQ